jgi:hypothetical protein
MSHCYLPALLGNILPKAGNFVACHAQGNGPGEGNHAEAAKETNVPVLTPARMSIES